MSDYGSFDGEKPIADYGSFDDDKPMKTLINEKGDSLQSHKSLTCGFIFAIMVLTIAFALTANSYYINSSMIPHVMEIYSCSWNVSNGVVSSATEVSDGTGDSAISSTLVTSSSSSVSATTTNTIDHSSTSTSSTTVNPPHIIFILADDLSWNSINGFNGDDLSSDILFVAPFLRAPLASGTLPRTW